MCVFPFTHCQKSVIFSFPSSKNKATFSSLFAIRKKLYTFRLLPVGVFSCALLKILFPACRDPSGRPAWCCCRRLRTRGVLIPFTTVKNVNNKKTPHCKLLVLNKKKRHLRLIAVRFFPLHALSKIRNLLSSKISYTLCPNNWAFFTLSQSLGKNLQ